MAPESLSTTLAHGPTQAGVQPGPGDRLPPGTPIGDYVIDRFLGAGAMGEVYAGQHPIIGKKVAIKLLRAELAASPESAERFVREAKATNQIDHPNVIDIFNFGRTGDGRLYLVMDLVSGTSLRARISGGPLDLASAFDILGTIADALDAAHARGVVHRDLKPDNVMLSADKPPKVFVLDFGIAKLVSLAGDGKLTGNGTLTGQGTWLGTPGYMAPEQWSSDGAGPASDRYALGVMAFELLSGKLPFSAANLPAMMEQHFRAPVPALSTRRGVSTATTERGEILVETLDPVLSRAMAKNPDERFPTGREMVDALRAAAGSASGPVATPAATARKLPWIPAAIGAGVLGLSIVGVLAVRGGKDRDTSEPAASRPKTERAPVGTVAMIVTSTPPGAEVLDASESVVGTTPHLLHPKPGDEVALLLRKPGYEPASAKLIAPDPAASEARRTVTVQLVQSNGFEGVWRLSNGELREFRRAGERVDIYKRDAVTGPREAYRSYDIVAAPTGVAFAGNEDVIDGRAEEHRCQIPHKVAYHYDPQGDALEVERERVGTKLQAGHCVVVSRTPLPVSALQRVDGGAEDVRYSDAPVGIPQKNPTKPSVPKSVKSAVKAPPQPDPNLAKKLAAQKQFAAQKPSKPAPQPSNAAPNPPNQAAPTLNKQKLGGSKQDPMPQQVPQPQVQAPNPDVEPQVPNLPQPQQQAPSKSPSKKK